MTDGLLGGGGDLNQQLLSLGSNPMFNMGMGLLQSHYDPRVNPFGAMMGGLQSAQESAQEAEDRKRAQELREALEEYFRRQQNVMGSTPIQRDQARMFQGLPPIAEYGTTPTLPGQAEPGRDYYDAWAMALRGQ